MYLKESMPKNVGPKFSLLFSALFLKDRKKKKKYLCLEEARKVNFLKIITLMKIMEKRALT